MPKRRTRNIIEHRLLHLHHFLFRHAPTLPNPRTLGWLVGLIGVPLLLGMLTPISLVGLLAYHMLYQVPGNIIGDASVDFFPAATEKRSNS